MDHLLRDIAVSSTLEHTIHLLVRSPSQQAAGVGSCISQGFNIGGGWGVWQTGLIKSDVFANLVKCSQEFNLNFSSVVWSVKSFSSFYCIH